MSFDPQPVTLEGDVVRLEPMSSAHVDDLFDVGRDSSIWTWMPRDAFTSREDVVQWVDQALADVERGSSVPFVIVERAGGRAIGSSRYLEITRDHRTLEIGWTWVAPGWQRTGVNTECKLLLLGHAFDDLDALRVQFKTHHANERSQRAIERIGAQREGVLRNHRIHHDGTARHSVYYSVTAEEWQDVKTRLTAMRQPRS